MSSANIVLLDGIVTESGFSPIIFDVGKYSVASILVFIDILGPVEKTDVLHLFCQARLVPGSQDWIDIIRFPTIQGDDPKRAHKFVAEVSEGTRNIVYRIDNLEEGQATGIIGLDRRPRWVIESPNGTAQFKIKMVGHFHGN